MFTSVALFNMLIAPLNAFPWVLNGVIEAWVSLKRIQEYVSLPEINLNNYYINLPQGMFPVSNYLFKGNNRNTRKRCEMYSKLTKKSLEWCHRLYYGVFIINFEHISLIDVSIVGFEEIGAL